MQYTQAQPAQEEIIVDGALLTQAFRRQLRFWAWLGLLLFALLLIAALALVPRSYTASASVALQQPSPGSSALAALTGAGSSSKRYIGVLKSRDLAQFVEKRVHLRRLYGAKTFPTEQDAVTLLTKSIKPDDNAADGLLYITVTLPGPPKLSLERSPTVAQIEAAAAQAANAYVVALKNYYINNDTDQGSLLLRGADREVAQARAEYDQASQNVEDFTRGLKRVDARVAPSSPSSGGASDKGDAAVASSGLADLYSNLRRVQADLFAAQAAQRAREQAVNDQLGSLGSLPGDDPLLNSARQQVTDAQTAYNTAKNLYGPENPAVLRAKTQLQVAQDNLARQTTGVKARLTTPDSRSNEEITSLEAKQVALKTQVTQAESRLGVSRELTGELTRLQREVEFRASAYQATLENAQKVKMENVSGQNRMFVIDPALPPKSGEPGMLRLGIVCLALVLVTFAVFVGRDYLRLTHSARILPAAAPLLNGNGAGTRADAETESAASESATRQNL